MRTQFLKFFTLLTVLAVLFTGCGEDEPKPVSNDDDQEINDDSEDQDDDVEVVITAEGFDITIVENPENDYVLDTIQASADDESELSYTLSNESASGAFTINDIGEVSVLDGTLFDFESSETMTAEIEVSSGEVSETVTVTVNLTDYILEADNGLLAYYPLNGNVNDESGNGNDGEESTDLLLATDRFGTANAAMDFSDNQYFWVRNFYDAEANEAKPFTISLWAKYDGANQGGYQTFMSKVNSSQVEISYRRRVLGSESWQDGSQEAYLAGNPSGGTRNSGSPFPIDEWTHIVMVFDPSGSGNANTGTLSLYENGELANARENVYSQLGNGIITVGNYAGMNAQGTPSGPGQSFSGLLDDIAFFDEALSDEDIAALYEIEE